MTAPSPGPSSCQRSEAEGRQDSEMASEPESHGATEGIAVCRSSVSPEPSPSTVTSAPQNVGDRHSQSDTSAASPNSQPSEDAISGATDRTAHGTDAWRVTIEDLPDEILVKIFTHMSFSELLDVIRKVCPRWRRLSQDFELWTDKEYDIRYWSSCDTHTNKGSKTDEEAVQTFRDVPNLRKVRTYRGARSCVFRALYNNCHQLSDLHLHYGQRLSYSVLKNLVEKCCRIQTLSISNELLMSEERSEAVSRLEHLRVLNLQVYDTSTIPVLRPLADGCPQLSEVDFMETVVNIDDLRHFLNAKRNTLKSLRIKWTMTGRKCVLPLLTVCADTLERLELYDFDVVRDEAREAFTALGSLKNLRELAMKIGDPAPPGTAALAFKSGGLPNLRLLDLRQCYGLDDDTVIGVSRGCPALRELLIRDAELLSDAAFSQIHRLKNLEILDVSYCRNLGGALIPCLARLPRLRTLTMEDQEFPKMQPGLGSILELSTVHSLSFNYSVVTGVPFEKFPGKLVSLRVLKIQGCRGDPNATDGLTEQMPQLKIEGHIEPEDPPSDGENQEDDWEHEEEENEENAEPGDGENAGPGEAGPGDGDEALDDDSESGEGGGGDSDDVVWDESSISILFLEDV